MLNKKWVKVLTVILVIFMTFNITISCMAADRQQQRRQNIEPKNEIDRFLDKYYPDEYLDRVYNNKIEMDT